jgi:hypothetical protein
VTHRRLEDHGVLLRLELSVENCGTSLLRLGKGLTRVSRILPLKEELPDRMAPPFSRELSWPPLEDDVKDWTAMHIEPGEVDSVAYDFVLEGDVRTILIYSHVENSVESGKTPIGWQKATVYEIGADERRESEGDATQAASSQAYFREQRQFPELNPAAGREAPATAARREEGTAPD